MQNPIQAGSAVDGSSEGEMRSRLPVSALESAAKRTTSSSGGCRGWPL
jgi:hypothetical protein